MAMVRLGANPHVRMAIVRLGANPLVVLAMVRLGTNPHVLLAVVRLGANPYVLLALVTLGDNRLKDVNLGDKYDHPHIGIDEALTVRVWHITSHTKCGLGRASGLCYQGHT